LYQLIEARHLRSALKERLGNLRGLSELGCCSSSSRRSTCRKIAPRGLRISWTRRRQAAEQGEMLDALFELIAGLLQRLLGLLTRRDIREGDNTANDFPPGVQQWAEAE